MTAPPPPRTFELHLPLFPDCPVLAHFGADDLESAARQAADHLRALYAADAAVYQLDACPAQFATRATFRAPVHAVLVEVKPAGPGDLRRALRRHAEAGEQQSLEAYTLAVALREVDPPLGALPRIIAELPRLAVHARGSVRDVEVQLRALTS